jgi:hypothetical protein
MNVCKHITKLDTKDLEIYLPKRYKENLENFSKLYEFHGCEHLLKYLFVYDMHAE